VQFTECPYSREGYRHHIQGMLNDFEHKYKGTKQGIVKSFLDMLPLLQQKEQQNNLEIKQCTVCKEAASKDICNACIMREAVQNV